METAPIIAAWTRTKECPVPRQKSSDEEVDRRIGARLARLRKARRISQVELGKKLGIPQPIICRYEKGEVRLHGEMILRISRILRVSADQIVGLKSVEPSGPKGILGHPDWRGRLEKLERLPKRDRDALLRTIDAFLVKAKAGA